MSAIGDAHIETMMSWFETETDLRQWAGPDFRYPFDRQSFEADLQMDRLASRVLVSDHGELLAFGQYYRRLNRCHLGRLAVSPEHRGQGVAAALMQELIDEGRQKLHVEEASLFVLADNPAAIRAYERFGFEERIYPETLPLPNCLYLVKRLQ